MKRLSDKMRDLKLKITNYESQMFDDTYQIEQDRTFAIEIPPDLAV